MDTFRNKRNLSFLWAVLLGLMTGSASQFLLSDQPGLLLSSGADLVAEIFMRLLKLVSLPVIFLSIASTASGMRGLKEIRFLGGKVAKYTLLTTLVAAGIALLLFVLIRPAEALSLQADPSSQSPQQEGSYWSYLLNAIPSNIIQPFIDNSVLGVLLLAMAFGLAALSLPEEQKKVLHGLFSSLYAAIMKVTLFIVSLMPLAVWAFVHLFYLDMQKGLSLKTVGWYLLCVLLANSIQGLIVLPLLLKLKGRSPLSLFRAMYPALSLAFFSKSSSAALPLAIKCAEERGKVSGEVAGFSLPLCTTINMNACAAFILTTVLFVSMSYGVAYTPVEMLLWVFISTLAAIGNAGVPMGCFFLSQAFLASMNVPLNLLMVILPFYSLIDMFESAINVWSDSCVAACVQQEVEEALPQAEADSLPIAS